ncbi:MAG: ATP-dependent Clp protease proteolytic subunit [Ignavibacteriaceae bacterium]|nr:ATP-dependent Clp protease proteolytic subunit [Ignavibacteriaceae bacterium]
MSKKENSAPDQQLMLVEYALSRGVNIPARELRLVGEINEKTFQRVDARLGVLEMTGKEAITIKILSGGGEVYSALGIIGRMQQSDCSIITQGYGNIMSAAALVLAMGDIRHMSKHAWVMKHEYSYGIRDRHSEIKELVAQVDREMDQWAELMASKCGKNKKFWKELINKKDFYLSAKECLKLGIVDKLI